MSISMNVNAYEYVLHSVHENGLGFIVLWCLVIKQRSQSCIVHYCLVWYTFCHWTAALRYGASCWSCCLRFVEIYQMQNSLSGNLWGHFRHKISPVRLWVSIVERNVWFFSQIENSHWGLRRFLCWGLTAKLHLVKYDSSIALISGIKSCWNCAKFENDFPPEKLFTKFVSWDLSVSEGFPLVATTPRPRHCLLCALFVEKNAITFQPLHVTFLFSGVHSFNFDYNLFCTSNGIFITN